MTPNNPPRGDNSSTDEQWVDEALNRYGLAIVQDFGDGKHKNNTKIGQYYPEAKKFILAHLNTVRAEADRLARKDELKLLGYEMGMDKPRSKYVRQKYVRISYYKDRLSNLKKEQL